MKIVFLGLASTFTPGMTYQDNLLCEQTVADGHQVTYISNPERFEAGEIVSTDPEDTVLSDGMRLIRLPYRRLGPNIVTKKIRCFPGVYQILEDERPDMVFCHGTQFWSILDVVRYKKAHPEVKLYADTHADYYTSGTNWLSRKVLHGIYYRYLVRKALPFLEKYFYCGGECRRFSAELYGVPEDRMEFYPLGGIILPEVEYQVLRAKRRAELGVREDTHLLVHAGKLEPQKRTDALLRAFTAVPELGAKLAVIGSIPDENKTELTRLMKADDRVVYLGWKSGEELQEYLCACDLYCQPGKVSAIMQNAVCRNCPLLLYPHKSYLEYYNWGNVLWVETEAEMTAAFRALAEGTLPLAEMAANSARCAREMLDYRALAARLYR